MFKKVLYLLLIVSCNQHTTLRISNFSDVETIHVLWKNIKDQNRYHASVKRSASIDISEIPFFIEILANSNEYEIFYLNQAAKNLHIIYRKPQAIKHSKPIVIPSKKREPFIDPLN